MKNSISLYSFIAAGNELNENHKDEESENPISHSIHDIGTWILSAM
jgi:hypothetical protein